MIKIKKENPLNKYIISPLPDGTGWYGRKKENPIILFLTIAFVFAAIIFGWIILS